MRVLRGDVPTTLQPMLRAEASQNANGAFGAQPSRLKEVTLRGDVWIGKDASIGPRSCLDQVILGEGARVPPGARLTRVVVWDGAEVPDRPLSDAIVTRDTVVEVHP